MELINKQEFIRKLHNKIHPNSKCYDSCKKEMAIIYDAFIEVMTEEILKGNSVKLPCFGTFRLKKHKGHKTHYCGYTKSDKSIELDDYLTLNFDTSRKVMHEKIKAVTPELLKVMEKAETQNETTENND